MTRSIRRGYPYPAHGRKVCYSGIHSIEALHWRNTMRRIDETVSGLGKTFAQFTATVGSIVDSLYAWYESIPPEVKAALADAAKAQHP